VGFARPRIQKIGRSSRSFSRDYSMKRSIVGLAAAALFSAAAGGACAATNLIQDGGFEGGPGTGADPSPWTADLWGIVHDAGVAHDGEFFARTGCTGAGCVDPKGDPAQLSQDVGGLTVGADYTLSFFAGPLNQNGSQITPNALKVFWGDQLVLDLADITVSGYQPFTLHVTATSATQTLAFLGRNDFGGQILDDVSLVAVGDTGNGGVPEPAAWALMITGLGLAGTQLRRQGRLRRA
jgi:hypothetical protein